MTAGALINLFGVFFVGGITILFSLLGYWVLFKRPEGFIEMIRKSPLLPRRHVGMATLGLSGFGLGLFAEGVTDFLTDSESGLTNTVAVAQRAMLGREDYHRFSALFRKKSDGSYEMKVLGRAILDDQSEHVARVIQDRSFVTDPVSFVNAGLDDWVYEDLRDPWEGYGWMEEQISSLFEGLPADPKKRKAVYGGWSYGNRLYYPAKNWAYSNPNYSAELEGLQRRIDWSRSSFLILSWGGILSGVWLTFASFLFLAACLIHRFLNDILSQVNSPWRESAATWIGTEVAKAKAYLLQALSRAGKVALVAVPAAWMSVIAYRHAEDMFNERALGYHVSYLQRQSWEHQDRESADLLSKQRSYDAVVWMRTAAEYRALCMQTYAAASDAIRARSAQMGERSRTLAVVLDLDETVLDNSAHSASLIERGEPFTARSWRTWVEDGLPRMRVVPGAREFLADLLSQRIVPIYITNRSAAELPATLKVLRDLKLDTREDLEKRIFPRKEEDSKEERRRQVRERYEILALIGDNLADFSEAYSAKDGLEKRWARVEQDREKWGHEWFVLPNPSYGDWTLAIDWGDPAAYFYEPDQDLPATGGAR